MAVGNLPQHHFRKGRQRFWLPLPIMLFFPLFPWPCWSVLTWLRKGIGNGGLHELVINPVQLYRCDRLKKSGKWGSSLQQRKLRQNWLCGCPILVLLSAASMTGAFPSSPGLEILLSVRRQEAKMNTVKRERELFYPICYIRSCCYPFSLFIISIKEFRPFQVITMWITFLGGVFLPLVFQVPPLKYTRDILHLF